ncbi:hypothetical protein Ping_3491 [Psychromonas ingrahamii 37]|uniref:AsmA domain-containing protein n=1 Tax=Psychromonas ingrahamii (strain DSM 17664 / CCUG 51855 / 37) TaxID=357804 RepID=A1T0A9_PSYIN|nr:hypothetical protein [Psychromonas ingrahamii]ABM05174.1 hypothetical protein Ping_3491 [Psychromonas ingrahamii 37]
MKRCFVTGAFILGLLGFLLLLFIRFFDINAHRGFISKQIEQLSGYQVNFESVDSHLFSDYSVSLSGLSLTIANRQVFYVDKVKVNLTKLNLWQRQLKLGEVQLTGVRISGDTAAFINTADVKIVENSNSVQQTAEVQIQKKLAWQRLTISRFSVNDLKIEFTHAGQRVVLDGADFTSDNLQIIADHKLVKMPFSGNLKLLAREFTAQPTASKTLTVKNLQLTASFNLKNLQANLSFKAGSLNLAFGPEEVALQNTELVAELNNNKASITKLTSQIFSGQLQLQAEALFLIKPLSSPFLSVQQLTVQKLAIKNMNVVIPAVFKDSGAVKKNKLLFPITNLLLKELIVKNVNIRSDNSTIPLVINNLNAAVTDFVLLQNKQLQGLAEEKKQAGSFAVQFDYLRWMESNIEQFEISGKLSQDDDGALLIKKLLAE